MNTPELYSEIPTVTVEPLRKHTPGPWTLYGDTCVAYRGELVAEVLRGGKRQLPIQSNRKLIAAAPEMLAQLKAALSHIEQFDTTSNQYRSITDSLRAAIASAT